MVALKSVDEAPPLKVWRLLQRLFVVVPKPKESVMDPVEPEVRSGYEAATLVTPELVSVVPPSESPEPMVSVLTGDAPLPRRIPLSVVEPVPPLATVRALVRLSVPIQAVVAEKSVDVAFANVLSPVQVLLFARSVEDAAVIVAEPPRAKVVPLMVETPALARSELPIDVVAMTVPFTSVARSLLVMPEIPSAVVVALVAKSVVPVKIEEEALPNVARPVNHEAPETEKSELDALPKTFLPVKELLSERSEEEAALMVAEPFAGIAIPLMVERLPLR